MIGSMGYFINFKNGVFVWGYNPLILTFDPNFLGIRSILFGQRWIAGLVLRVSSLMDRVNPKSLPHHGWSSDSPPEIEWSLGLVLEGSSLKLTNRGQTGSRYVNIYIYIIKYKYLHIHIERMHLGKFHRDLTPRRLCCSKCWN